MFKHCGRRTDEGRMPDHWYTISSPMSLWLRWANNLQGIHHCHIFNYESLSCKFWPCHKKVKVNPILSFEQNMISLNLWCFITSFIKIGLLISGRKIFKGYIPYMHMAAILVMWQSSCELISFPCTFKITYTSLSFSKNLAIFKHFFQSVLSIKVWWFIVYTFLIYILDIGLNLNCFSRRKQMSPPFWCQKHESLNTISNRNITYNF